MNVADATDALVGLLPVALAAGIVANAVTPRAASRTVIYMPAREHARRIAEQRRVLTAQREQRAQDHRAVASRKAFRLAVARGVKTKARGVKLRRRTA